MTDRSDAPASKRTDFRQKLSPDVWDFTGDINYIKELEAQESLTNEQLKEIITKEQYYLDLAKRLGKLREKEVRG